jgi:hypothetical protein
MQELLQDHFNPRRIGDPDLRGDMETALEYQRQIEAQVRSQRPGMLRDRLEDTANQLSDWISNIHRLALRLDDYRKDALLAREREQVPSEMEALAAQRSQESDSSVRQVLDEVLKGKNKQWEALQMLDARMKQAELLLEQSLTALATVYSQVQLIDAQHVDSSRSDLVLTDIQEQVDRLNDLVSSINEVYEYHGAVTGKA